MEMRDRIYWTKNLRGIENRNPILVHQMGKVGSSTIVATLHQLSLDAPILHTHTLTHEHIRKAKRRVRQLPARRIPEHLTVSTLLRRKMDRSKIPFRVITLAREPVSRAISFVFEDYRAQLLKHGGELTPTAVTHALNGIFERGIGLADPTPWFEREINGLFGIDVFGCDFDHGAGYMIYRCKLAELLVIRTEDINRSLAYALGELLGLDPESIKLSNANEGEKKWYAALLRSVKKSYRLSPQIADRVFSTKYFSHFYGHEAEEIRSWWTS